MAQSPVIIPSRQTKQWSQLNKGDLLGTLFATKNIDLDTPGILKLSQRTRYVGQDSGGGNFGNMLSIVYGNFQSTTTTYQYWMVSDFGNMYTLSADLATFAVDGLANTPAPGTAGDATGWNGNLYVTKLSRVAKLAAGTWTTDWSSANFTSNSAGIPHPIEPNVTNGNLLVGDGNLLKRCIADGTISTAVTFPSNYIINWIRRGANVNYIGLDSKAGGVGAVATWDGLDTTLEYNSLIPMKCRTPLSGAFGEDGVLRVAQSDGRLMKFNGSGFAYEAELPTYRDYLARRDWGGSLTVAGRVLQRGMAYIRGKLHLSIDTGLNSTPAEIPNFLGGVYCYDDDNKAFYHKYSGSNSQTVTDFGQLRAAAMCSAISPIFEGRNIDPAATVGGKILFGGGYYLATTGSTGYTVVSAVTGANRGTFTTCRIECSGITQDATALYCKYQGLTTSADKILFKYRTKYRDPILLQSGIPTWTSTTVFTTTDTGMASAEVGDEITVLHGNGAGSTAHIVSMPLAAGTYTVTLDEAITGVSSTNTSQMILDNWKKLTPTIIYTDVDGYRKISLPVAGKTWFQIKGELRGEGDVVGIQELQLVNKDKLPAE